MHTYLNKNFRNTASVFSSRLVTEELSERQNMDWPYFWHPFEGSGINPTDGHFKLVYLKFGVNILQK